MYVFPVSYTPTEWMMGTITGGISTEGTDDSDTVVTCATAVPLTGVALAPLLLSIKFWIGSCGGGGGGTPPPTDAEIMECTLQ
jgi:hypothetical protein